MKTVKEVVQELVGSASLCWTPKPEGVFDSTQALKFTEDALQSLIDIVEGMKKHVMPELINDDPNDVLSNREKSRQSYNNFADDLIQKIKEGV